MTGVIWAMLSIVLLSKPINLGNAIVLLSKWIKD